MTLALRVMNPFKSKALRNPSHPELPEVISGPPGRSIGETARTRHLTLGAAILISGLCAALYSWTLDFPLEFDDHVYLVDNPLFPDPASFRYPVNFAAFANRPAQLGTDPDFAVNFILRPVAYGSFFLNHLLDGYQPRYYRLANIVIHGCNALLLFAILQVLLGKFVRSGSLRLDSALFISTAASLLLLVHPLSTESVTYIIQRFTSMATMFSLLALWLYFLSFERRAYFVRLSLRTASVASLLLAMLTKESAVMVPVLAVLLDRLVRDTPWRTALRKALPLLACLPVIPILVLLTAQAQNGGCLSWERCIHIVNRKDAPFEYLHYLVTQLTVVLHYLRLLIWPSGLNLDPEWPTYKSVWQTPVLVSLTVLSGMLGGAWWLYRTFRHDARMRLVFPSLLWFFCTVSVSSGLVPLPDLVAEHRSYFPSIGIFVLGTSLLDWLRTENSGRWQRILVPLGTACFIGGLSLATCARNEVWRSAVGLWQDTVSKSPGKSRAWSNLGTAYARSGNQEKAIECYRKSLALEPKSQTDMRNLAISLLCSNQPEEALRLTQRLVAMNHGREHVSIAEVMGTALRQLHRNSEALAIFRRILEVDPANPAANFNLGQIYHQAGRPSRALSHYKRALKRFPGNSQIATAIAELQRTNQTRFQ